MSPTRTSPKRKASTRTQPKRKLSTRTPAKRKAATRTSAKHETPPSPRFLTVPLGVRDIELDFGGRIVKLTNLDKPFWPELGITKRDLLQYSPSRWSTERSTEWQPLRPKLVVEVEYDHVSGRRFRHGTGFVRWRPDKAPRQCTMEQLAQPEGSLLHLLKKADAPAARLPKP